MRAEPFRRVHSHRPCQSPHSRFVGSGCEGSCWPLLSLWLLGAATCIPVPGGNRRLDITRKEVGASGGLARRQLSATSCLNHRQSTFNNLNKRVHCFLKGSPVTFQSRCNKGGQRPKPEDGKEKCRSPGMLASGSEFEAVHGKQQNAQSRELRT